MKTLYIFRDSYDAQYILSELAKRDLVTTVIIERGTVAKKEKLKRIIKKTSLLKYPLTVIDLTALVLYSSIMIKRMKKMLGEFEYPQGKIKLTVDDANEPACIDFIKRNKPDVIFIYGTAILKENFLREIVCPVFNIHSGILPHYRNVHSDFWAFKKKDFDNIGISIIYLDSGIDSGDIALQKKIAYVHGDSLVDVKVKNLRLIPIMVRELMQQVNLKKVKRIKQDTLKKGFYPTPGFRDIIKFTLSKH